MRKLKNPLGYLLNLNENPKNRCGVMNQLDSLSKKTPKQRFRIKNELVCLLFPDHSSKEKLVKNQRFKNTKFGNPNH